MASQLGEAQIPIRALLDKLDGDLDKARGKVEGSIGKIVGNIQKVGGVALAGIGLATGAIAGLGVGLAKLAIDAAPLQTVADAFDGVAESAGIGGDEMLAAMQKGSAGMISQRDLMLSFNKAAQLVSTDFATTLPDAMQFLGKVAGATGQDLDFLLESLVVGVGRVSPMILDNLGVQVSLTEAVEDWAIASGKAATKMIDNSKAMAELAEKVGFAEREYAIMAESQQKAVEAGKDTAKLDLRMDKKASQVAEYRAELDKLSSSHGTTFEDFDELVATMTKAEQQEAILALTLKKLAENTAAMPDVTESAAAQMARFAARIQDTKDQIGLALLPVLSILMGFLGQLVDRFLPPLIEMFESRVVPALEKGADALQGVIWILEDLATGALGRDYPWEDVLPPELAEIATRISDAVFGIIDTVTPYLEIAKQWISENIEVKDVLIALGIAIGVFIAGAIAPLLGTIATVVLVFAGLVLAVAAVRKAWATDWGGIRTKTEEVMAKIGPAFEIARAWLEEKIPIALAAVSEFWTTTLQPALAELVTWFQTNIPLALAAVSTFWTETLQPALEAMTLWLGENIPVAIETLTTLWNETLLPALEAGWAFIDTFLVPIFEDVLGIIGELGRLGFEALAAIWHGTLKPALDSLWGRLKDIFTSVDGDLSPAMKFLTGVVDTLKGALDGLKGILSTVHGSLEKVRDVLSRIKIPAGLNPGSPSPFELSLRGITDQARAATLALTGMDRAMPGARGGLGFGGAGGGITVVVVPMETGQFRNLRGEFNYTALADAIMKEKLG